MMGFKLAACPPSPCDRCRRLPLNVARSTGAGYRSQKEKRDDGGVARKQRKMEEGGG